jgi:disulfide oxidoreductase YuzD
MIDSIQAKELLDVLEEVYEVVSMSKDVISGAKVRTKDAKQMMKDWAERNELIPENVNRVYTEYAAYRDGKLKWDGESTDDQFVELLVAIQDKVLAEKVK